jgi:hypothetical protein
MYLLKKGFKVIGVDLSEIAVEQFFTENQLDFSIKKYLSVRGQAETQVLRMPCHSP